MSQAKTLTERELRRVLDYCALTRHAARNRVMVLLTFYAGLRVSEVAALKYSNVVAPDNTIKSEFRLTAEQTKGGHARTVFISEKLRKELAAYVKTLKRHEQELLPLFRTQKRDGFTANTLCQHFHLLYRRAGVVGASSHSGRRTFITNLAAKGVGVRVLAALAGHRNPATTMVYIDASDDMKRAAVQLI
ncbi:tyrosine-type recombinase/integrase [Acidovorax delafieldii]|uniref:tyrosine-type recombinase/integrase n=1 Tax=Acidovorax delafieldii TaxID=47920 RepID=UPI003ECC1CCE